MAGDHVSDYPELGRGGGVSRTRQLLGVWLQEGDQGRRLLQHVMAPRQQRRSAIPAQHDEISHNRPAESAANESVLCNRRRMGGPLVKEQDVLGSRNDEVERMPGMSRKTARTPPHTHSRLVGGKLEWGRGNRVPK